MTMEIPTALMDKIIQGNVILFLGSGASKKAKDKKGNEPPDGEQLAELLTKKFLGGKYKKYSLAVVSELAIAATDLFEVQDFIAEIFKDFEPDDFHYILPSFKWRALVSTNYDHIIERVYQNTDKTMQNLVPFISNNDRIDEKLRNPNNLPLIKLHGCISRTHDSKIPLILTVDQYITHQKNRDRLFNMLEEWAYENTIVFIGYGLEDMDVRQSLLKLSSNDSRPRYYLVNPELEPEVCAYWQSKRIIPLKCTFEDFLNSLAIEIPTEQRKLQRTMEIEHPIEAKFKVSEKINEITLEFLNNDFYYINQDIVRTIKTPKEFFKGFDLEWYPIENNLDVKRNLIEIILSERIAILEEEKTSKVEFILIKSEAGGGKTTFLKRLAWESGIELEAICLYLRDYGNVDFEKIYNIYRMTKERIFVFIDNAADHINEIDHLLNEAKNEKMPLTLFSVERTNEWNTECERIESLVTDFYTLPYLNDNEIKELLEKLEKYDCLGYLKNLKLEERIKELQEKTGRQLLVALHEATHGKPFVQILVDEYKKIKPQLAQSIYLSVCVLNRLKVPVRAGLVSRVFGVSFTEFKNKFYAPLDHVVNVKEWKSIRDYVYFARHPYIAEIVFEQILTNQKERYDEYIKLLSNLNLSYNTDRAAFRQLIKGKKLKELFSDYQNVKAIFKIASDISPDDPYLYHQWGIYEIHQGNLDRAESFLIKAKKLDIKDNTIIHSLANLILKRSQIEKSKVKKNKYAEQAEKLTIKLLDNPATRKYAFHTLISIYMDELKNMFDEDNSSEIEINKIVKKIEKHFEVAKQEYPGDSLFYSTESKFCELINNEKKAWDTLEKAFKINKRDSYLAIRLSKIYHSQGNLEKAIDITKEAIDCNQTDMRLRFRLAEYLIEAKEDTEDIIHNLRRSFTKGDRNFESQFWYARYCFVSQDEERFKESKEIFDGLREAPIYYVPRTEIKDKITENEKTKIFTGTVESREENYGFIQRDGRGDKIFLHKTNTKNDAWESIKQGKRVRFEIAFTFNGPTALNTKIL